MDRVEFLRKFIAKEHLGIEIGPWCNPLVPKREGYRALSLDVFDRATLQQRLKDDPLMSDDLIPNIEEVDLIGPAGDLDRLAAERGLSGQVDYIISSHNFEHLPNPIRFLNACAQTLRSGGILVMAIPDRRSCFDYFRGQSQSGDFIAAFFEDRQKPTIEQMFSQTSMQARWRNDGHDASTFLLDTNPAQIIALDKLQEAFDVWEFLRAAPDNIYRDQHCWTFIPASFELIIRDLRFLGLISLDLDEISGPCGCEFYVRLSNSANGAAVPDHGNYAVLRNQLLHRVNSEASANSIAMADALSRIEVLEREIQLLKHSPQTAPTK